MDEVFPRNPISEVHFEVRFPLSLRVLRDVCVLQDEWRMTFPQLIHQEEQSGNAPSIISYGFISGDGVRSITVGAERFALSVRRYETFELFLADVLHLTHKFSEIVQLDHFLRVGLRYVNQIRITLEGGTAPVSKYVRPYVDLPRIRQAGLSSFSVQLAQSREGCFMGARTGFFPLSVGEEAATGLYLLDLDAFVQGERYSLEQLPVLLDTLHKAIQGEFLDHITEEYKNIMRGDLMKPLTTLLPDFSDPTAGRQVGGSSRFPSEFTRPTGGLPAGDVARVIMNSIRDHLPTNPFARMEVCRELVRQFETDAGTPFHLGPSAITVTSNLAESFATSAPSSEDNHDDLGEWLLARPTEPIEERNASSIMMHWLASAPPESVTHRMPFPGEDDAPGR